MTSRVESVLRIRALAERLALGRLAQGREEARQADRLVAERRAVARSVVAPQPLLSPVQLRALRLQGMAAHELVTGALTLHEQAEARVAELQRAWSAASADRKSVERLAERRDAEAAAAANTAAQRALDELALLRRGRS